MSYDTYGLISRLLEWADNEEMINQYYTAHGKDCIEAAKLLTELERSYEDMRKVINET